MDEIERRLSRARHRQALADYVPREPRRQKLLSMSAGDVEEAARLGAALGLCEADGGAPLLFQMPATLLLGQAACIVRAPSSG